MEDIGLTGLKETERDVDQHHQWLVKWLLGLFIQCLIFNLTYTSVIHNLISLMSW
jgi:hypothetical protein